MFDNLKTKEGVQGDQDRLGFSVLDSDVYTMTIENAYLDKSDSGAMSMNISYFDDNGNTLKDTQWITSGDAKGNSNTYEDRKGNHHYLPGFNIANAIANFILEEDLSDVEVTEKTLKIYDKDAQKETAQKKPVITGLLNRKIKLGILKIEQNKQVSKDNAYVATNDKIEVNEVDKVFCAETNRTISEAYAQDEVGTFIDKWIEKNQGKVINKFKEITSGSGKKDAKKGKKKDLFAS